MDQPQSKGFTLPTPQDSTAGSGGDQSIATYNGTLSAPAANTTVPYSSKGLLIGGGILLVFLLIFFFIKNAYGNSLVTRKVSPRQANQAAWWLFLLLSTLAAGVIFSVIQPGFLKILYLGPLGALALISLVLLVLSSSRR